MRKLFLIPLLACFSCVMAWAVNVGTLTDLKTALGNGGSITLTNNITTSEQLDITKATTIDGQGFYIKSTDGAVLNVNTTGNVVLRNVTLYAAKAADGTSGILLPISNINLTVDNVKINSTCRGISMPNTGCSGLNVEIKNSIISLIWGGNYAEDGTANVNYDFETESAYKNYSRGLNIYPKNSTFTLKNTTIQGFFYNINVPNQDVTGLELTANDCTFKGRDALNMHGQHAKFTFNDCSATGINNFGGGSEVFACFVLDENSNDVQLTINGGTVVSAVFNEVGGSNPNAAEFFLACRGQNNTITVNNAQYTCPRNLGSTKGGIIEYMNANNTVVINDGVYDFPEMIYGFYTADLGEGSLTINGGKYNLDSVASVYSYTYNKTLYYDYPSYDVKESNLFSLKGGTYSINMEKVPVVYPGLEGDSISLIADGYKQVVNANGTYSIVPNTVEEKAVAEDIEWAKATDWSDDPAEQEVPDENSSVVIGNGTDDVTATVKTGTEGEAYRVDLQDKTSLVIEDNAVLTIGEGGIVAHEEAEITVKEGATLVLNGLVQGTENLVIETSETNTAAVLIDPAVNTYGDEHPVGTFRFTSKSYKNGDKVVHQRFGMPTYNTGVEMKYATTSSAATYITNWDYENDQWKQEGGSVAWTAVPTTGSLNLVTAGPFACYDLISNNAKGAEITYEFKGALMGNADADMSFNSGFNPYANSYTAPIDIETFLNRIADAYAGTGISPTIYLYKALANDNYTWVTIGQDAFEFGDAEYTTIAPMQAFMMYLGSSIPQSASIDYADNVYDPFLAKLAAPAPARRAAAKQNYISVSILDAEGVEYDRVKLIEDNRFSSAFDNGYDAVKFMDEAITIYATADEAMATVASDYVEGMYVGVKATTSGVYTLNIKHNGLDYALIDTENNNVINLVAGATYTFYQEAGQNDARFQVVKVNKVPTAIGQVENDAITTKFVKDGALRILKNGVIYNAQGQIVK